MILPSAEAGPDAPESRSESGKPRDWSTPSAAQALGGHESRGDRGRGRKLLLTGQAKAETWPTPNSEQGTGYISGSNRDTWRPTLTGAAAGLTPTLHDTTRQRPAVSGSLNPAWVSQLCGLPDDWLVPLADLTPETLAAMKSAEPRRAKRRSASSAWQDRRRARKRARSHE